MIEIRNICKAYGSQVIFKNFNLRLEDGGAYALTGPSGAGKTTLLRLLLGLEAPDSGEIIGISGLRAAAVFQEDRLCPSFSPLENIRMVCGKHISRDFIRREALRLLPQETLDRRASTLSGGQKRRTAILRALLADSDLVVMDEPFTGLDEETKAVVLRYAAEKVKGKIFIFSTHDPEDAEGLGAVRVEVGEFCRR